MADKIKKTILWIRKSLEIITRTNVPGSIDDRIRPTIDVLGWERYDDVQTENVGLANSSTVEGTNVPEEVNRLYLAASVESNDIVNVFTYWIEMFPFGGDSVAVTAPVTPPANRGTSFIRCGGLPHPFVVGPGGTARGRSAPATAGGTVLRVRLIFIDIPLGEYIPAL